MRREPVPTTTQHERRPRMAAGHVLVAGVVALSLAALLNAPSLERTAQSLPHGAERRVATALAGPLARLSDALRLDRPRLALDRALGREPPAATVDAPPSTGRPGGRTDDQPPPLPTDGPLDVWIVGDSMVELFGPHLSDRMARTASGAFVPEVDFRYVSGLMRPEYFDWPSHVRARVRNDPPDVVVAMFGGNDGQSVVVDGTHYERWTRPWWRLYRSRVEEMMDLIGRERRGYWIGLPVMRSDDFSRHARQMNLVYRDAAAERAWMTYVDIWDVFTDASGAYADYLPDRDGDLHPMRYADGVHFTPQGAVRLARYVLDVLAEDLDVTLDRP